jgi:alpha-tubulin suppressor-like RCC1 family protein
VYVSGLNDVGQLGLGMATPKSIIPKRVPNILAKQVSAGADFSLLIGTDDTLYSFGENGRGQCGVCDVRIRWTPVPVYALDSDSGVTLFAGTTHSIVKSKSGAIYGFGSNASGQLGLGDTESRNSPKNIVTMNDLNINNVSAGGHPSGFTLASTATGDVYGWGTNEEMQLGKVLG